MSAVLTAALLALESMSEVPTPPTNPEAGYDSRLQLRPRFEVLLEGAGLGVVGDRGGARYSPFVRTGLGALLRSDRLTLGAFATWEASLISARVFGLHLSTTFASSLMGVNAGGNVDLTGLFGVYAAVSFGPVGLELQGCRLNSRDPALLMTLKLTFHAVQSLGRILKGDPS